MTMPSARPSVLFCTYSHNTRGGIEIWQRRLLAAFQAAGWQTTLGLARGKRFNDPDAYRRAMDIESVEVFDGRTGTDEGRILAIQRVIERLRPDVVVTTGLAHVLPAVGRLKLAGADLRLAYAIHPTNPSVFADVLSCDTIIDLAVGVNPLHAAFLRARGMASSTATVPCGTDLPERVRYGRKNDAALTLLFAGRFHQETKNVLDAVALAKELESRRVPFRFLMAGTGPDEDRLRSAIRESGLERRFELPGWVDQKTMHEEVLPRADVVLLFSPGEGNPIVLGEALAHGVVPVTTPFLGLRSLSWFREGENALTFPFSDVEALATLLQQLEADRNRLERLSRACHEASRSLSWDRCEQSWVVLLSDLAARPPSSPRSDFPLSRPAHAGRFDTIGLDSRTADRIRRIFHRFPDFSDGWGEWPGTLGLATAADAEQMMNELRSLDGLS